MDRILQYNMRTENREPMLCSVLVQSFLLQSYGTVVVEYVDKLCGTYAPYEYSSTVAYGTERVADNDR